MTRPGRIRHRVRDAARPSLISAAVAAFALLSGVLMPVGVSQRAEAAEAGDQPPSIVSSVNGLTVKIDELVSTPSVLDYDHPTATITGRARLFDPATGQYLQHSGGVMNVGSPTLAGSSSGKVAEDGTFAVTALSWAYVGDAPWAVNLLWTPDFDTLLTFAGGFPTRAPAATVWLPAVASSWRLVMDKTSLVVKAPNDAVLSGVVQRSVDGAWVAAPRTGVRVAGPDFITAPTDAAGRFSITVPVPHDRSIVLGLAEPLAMYLSSAAAAPTRTVKVDVLPTSRLSWTNHTVSVTGVLPIEGRLRYDEASGTLGKERITLQESKDGKTGWHDLKTVVAGSGQPFFYGGFRLVHFSSHYRLIYRGNGQLQPTTSAVITTKRRPTRIASWKVSPRKVYGGGPITLSGVVQKSKSGSFVGIGKKTRLEVRFRATGHQGWEYYSPRTWSSKKGTFRIKKTPTRDGYWYVVALVKESPYVYAYSKPVFVDVK